MIKAGANIQSKPLTFMTSPLIYWIGTVLFLVCVTPLLGSGTAYATQADTASWQADFTVDLPATSGPSSSFLNPAAGTLTSGGIATSVGLNDNGSASYSLSGGNGIQGLRSVLFNTSMIPNGMLSSPLNVTLSGLTVQGQLITVDMESNPSTGTCGHLMAQWQVTLN